MKLDRKKKFVANVLGIGQGRVIFNTNRLADIKEAMTRQDVKDLLNDGAIVIREIKGRATVVKRRNRRRAGSRKQIPGRGKPVYVRLTRKLRAYIAELLRTNVITKETYLTLRKEIKSHAFKNKEHLKERIGGKKK